MGSSSSESAFFSCTTLALARNVPGGNATGAFDILSVRWTARERGCAGHAREATDAYSWPLCIQRGRFYTDIATAHSAHHPCCATIRLKASRASASV